MISKLGWAGLDGARAGMAGRAGRAVQAVQAGQAGLAGQAGQAGWAGRLVISASYMRYSRGVTCGFVTIALRQQKLLIMHGRCHNHPSQHRPVIRFRVGLHIRANDIVYNHIAAHRSQRQPSQSQIVSLEHLFVVQTVVRNPWTKRVFLFCLSF